MTTDEKRNVIERYLDAYNRFDVERMLNVVHSDIKFENVSDGQVTAEASGASAFRKLAEQSKQMFSSRKQTVTKVEASGREAFVEVDYTGGSPERNEGG